METFKKSLKIALAKSAQGIKFEASSRPQLLEENGQISIEELDPIGDDELATMITSLIPESAEKQNVVLQERVEIVNFGKIKLLGRTGDKPKLYILVPPQGDAIEDQVLSDLNEVSIAPEPNLDTPPQIEGLSVFNSPPPSPTTDDLPNIFDNPATVQEQVSPSESIPSTDSLPADQLDELGFKQDIFGNNPSPTELSTEGPGSSQSIDNNQLNATEISLGKPEVIVPGGVDLSSLQETAVMSTNNSHQPMNPIGSPALDSELTPSIQSTPSQMMGTPIAERSAQPSKIHFGAVTPDESIDPNSVHAIDDILRVMIEQKASDLHLTQNQPICLRVDGEIHRSNDQLLDEGTMERLLLPIMPPKNQREFAEINDTDFAYEIPNLARFRVNIFRDLHGVGAVLRQIPNEILSADQLNLPDAIRNFCNLHKGLVLVTGPTGSGKSTTLAAMIDLINTHRKEHILTIEDPIEFVHKQKSCLINQREVHKHTGSFSRALKAALREDPDIILIGEMRDLETVSIAIETAETGHLVFGTLHTNTAISTVDRLVDQFPADQQSQIRVMLGESLKGVVSQTLVKKKSGGRAAAHEILVVDRAISSILREGNTHMIANQMQTQRSKGNTMLNDSLIELVLQDLVSPEDAWAKAIDKEAFETLAKSKGFEIKKAV